ncbi:MAG: tetratricopeptide repeat protein [Pseudomonadota bacterium]
MVDLIGGGGGPQQQQAGVAVDTSDATFMEDVVQASTKSPVVVLLWSRIDAAAQELSKTLEREISATRGAIKFARLDVDRNPMVVGQLQVQALPATIAFFQGQGVTGFQGVPGPAQIKEFIARLAEAVGSAAGGADDAQGGLEQAIEMAEQMLEQGMLPDAMQTFAAVIAEDPANARALAGLARTLLAMGQPDEARATLDNVPDAVADDPAIKAARAALELAARAGAAGEADALRAKLVADPDDHQTRLDLADALIGLGDNEAAVDALLELFRRDREWNEGAAKARLLTLIESLGPKDPLAGKARRRLSALIFS